VLCACQLRVSPDLGPARARTALAIDRYLRERRIHRDAERPELWLGHRGRVSSDGIADILEPALERRLALVVGMPARPVSRHLGRLTAGRSGRRIGVRLLSIRGTATTLKTC
jgi:hypothetical protein